MRSIKTKILSIYAFLIFLIFFVASVSILNLYSLNKAVDGLIASNYRSIVAARNMLEAIERQDSFELIYIQVENEKSIRSFYENQSEFLTWLTKARDNITEDKEEQVLDSISFNYLIYTEYFSRLQSIKREDGIEEASRFYSSEIYPLFMDIKRDCDELFQINEVAMFRSKDKAKQKSENVTYITAALSIISIILGLLVAGVYTKKIVEPIHKLIAGIKSIKEGNLNQEIEVDTDDEVGKLAVEFNNMTRRLYLYEKSNIRNLISEKNKSLAIVKSISDPIIVTDNNSRIMLVNKSAETVFNIIESEVMGKHFLESVNNPVIFDRIRGISENKEQGEDKVITIRNEDKTFYYFLTAVSIYDDEHSVVGAVVVMQDITAIKEIEQMKSDFIATISHELRTPLTSIIMGTDLLLDSMTGELNTDQVEIVTAMEEDSKQLLALVNDILNLSKLESGKVQMNFEETDIKSLIKYCIKTFMDTAAIKGVKLYYELSEKIPSVKLDTNKIVCVINNLIANALKFTQAGDEIKVTAVLENKLINIIVQDTGVGIPEEYKDIIFEKFVQLQDNAEGQVGTGLGLAISKEFVKRHGGEIWVEGRPEKGSTFIFTLPL
jgi:PAS domain S-box-containing protein